MFYIYTVVLSSSLKCNIYLQDKLLNLIRPVTHEFIQLFNVLNKIQTEIGREGGHLLLRSNKHVESVCFPVKSTEILIKYQY